MHAAQMDHVPSTYVDVIREVVEEQQKCGAGAAEVRGRSSSVGHRVRSHFFRRHHPWSKISSNGCGKLTRASKIRFRLPSTRGGETSSASFIRMPKGHHRHCGGIVRPSVMDDGGIVIRSPTIPKMVRRSHTSEIS
jgi:hypothetical protein